MFPFQLMGQQTITDHDIDVKLIVSEKTLEVSQLIQFTNTSSIVLKELYLNDWSHAYSSSKSPLAQRFAEEFDRSFYLGAKTKRGSTNQLNIIVDDNKIEWNRLKDQIDIVEIKLVSELKPGEQTTIELDYKIVLPNARYTGYGKISDTDYYLKNCFIHIAPLINNQWIKNSNLDLEEISTLPANFSIEWDIPADLFVNSNLTKWKENRFGTRKKISQSISNVKEIQFHITDKEYTYFSINGLKIGTDLREVEENLLDTNPSLYRIVSFVDNKFGSFPHNKMLISSLDYKKRAYFGLSSIPSIFYPFSDRFEFEIKALSVYLNHYLNEQFLVDPRSNFWLTGGLHTQILMDYIAEYYPNQKLLGSIPRQPLLKPFIKNYVLSKASFNHGFLYFSQFALRNNIQQAPRTPKSELIKFNERISQPSYVAFGINYASKFYGKEYVERAFKKQMGKIKSNAQLIQSLKQELDIPWFTSGYLNNRESIDLRIKSVKKDSKHINIEVQQEQDNLIPFTVALLKNDTIISSLDVKNPNKISKLALENLDADYIAINPTLKIPEFSQRNNYRTIKGSPLKKLKFTLIKDLEDDKRNQVFFNPKIDFNVYDGLTLGGKFSNKTLPRRPFAYELNPNYSSKLNELVGSLSLNYRIYNEDSPYYLTQFSVFGSSFHYDTNLRYKVFSPSISIFKRPKDFRSNERQAFSLSYVSVYRQFGKESLVTPNYNIGNLRYSYSNKQTIKFVKINSDLEFSDKFGKFNFNAEYRHLFHDGRTLSMRFFGGKFLWNKIRETTYFDYSLNRSTDYLFRYNYLGRSENDGFYSQQFILSEGGFKSRFENPNANDYLASVNLAYSLWKWVEVYADFGVTKNLKTKSQGFYDSGLRLNLVPDYLEFYFPIQNSQNYVLDDRNYLSNMRFVLTVDLNNLKQLFSRRWF